MTTRLIFPLALFALVAVAAGCRSTTSDPVVVRQPFVMNFTDFAVHIGDDLYLKVIDTTNGVTVHRSTPFTVDSDEFMVTVPDLVVPGRQYQIDFFADVDGDGMADRSPTGDPPGVDHTWRLFGTAGATGLTINYAHDAVFTDITPF